MNNNNTWLDKCKSLGLSMAHMTIPSHAGPRSVRAYSVTDRHRSALDVFLGRPATPSEVIAMCDGFQEYVDHRFDELMEKSE